MFHLAVELYVLIMEFFATDPSRIAYGREGYYFVENGEYLHRDLAVRVSQVLFALGAIEGPELVRFATNEEIEVHARTVSTSCCPSEGFRDKISELTV